MSDFYQNYTEGPSNNPNRGDMGTAPMVLGLISLICSLTFSRLAGIILGIIAVCLSSGIRKENSQANAGFIMGSTIRLNVLNSPDPSILAASTRDSGRDDCK